MIRPCCLAAGLAVLLFGCSSKQSTSPSGRPTLTKAWETEPIFKNPESAVFDPEREVIYVSNVNGGAAERNGLGFLSRMSPEGKVLELEWVKGLNAPKGMAIRGDKLYVADIDALVEIDLKSGDVTNRFEAPGARFLNDVTEDTQGCVYVSDTLTNTIHRLDEDRFEPWIKSDELENPSGLLGEGHRVLVASWGVCDDSFATTTPGHLKAVSRFDKSITDVGDGRPLGNLDGIEVDGGGGYYVSDRIAGKIIHIDRDGAPVTLLTLKEGTADVEFIGRRRLFLVPMMEDNKIVAYTVE